MIYKKYKSIISNFLSLSSLQLINYIFPLIIFPYVISIIGLEKFGILAFVTATTNYFSSFVDYGFNISATRDISKFRHNKKILNLIYNRVLSIKIYLFLISFIVFSIMILNIESLYRYKEIYFISFSSIIGLIMFPMWFFLGMEDMKYIAVFNFISRIVFLFLLVILVKTQADYWIVPLLTSLGFLIVGILSLSYIKNKYKMNFKLLKFNRLYKEINLKKEIFIVYYIPILFANSIYTMLGIFSNNINIGIYSVSEKIMMLIENLLQIIANSFYPSIVKDIKKFNLLKKIMLISGSALTIMVFVFSSNISFILVGDESITDYLKLISITLFFTSIYITYGLLYLIVIKKDKVLKNINITISTFGLIYTFLLIKSFDIQGAILSIIVTKMLLATFTYLYYKQNNMEQC